MTSDGLAAHTVERCPYCGDPRSRRIRDRAYVKCRGCGLVRPVRMMSQSERGDALARTYREGGSFDRKPLPDCLGVHPPIELAVLRANCSRVLAGGRALDVGCAVGDFVSCLNHMGMRASGIEAFGPWASVGRAHGLDVREGTFAGDSLNALFGGEQFDFISFRESLYYMDFHTVFADVRQRLKATGFLYIKSVLANSPHFWIHKGMASRMGSFMTVLYSVSTLRRILVHEGFELVAIERLPYFGLSFAKMLALPERIARFVRPALAQVTRLLPPDNVLIVARPRA